MTRLDWPPIIARAAEVVRSYLTGVTLRQLYYRLVSEGLFSNRNTNYKQLSARTAEARRRGGFPPLIDNTRTVHRYQTWTSPQEALDHLKRTYRRDRTEGQPARLYIGVEKNGMVEQLMSWFGDTGIPILAMGGYGSQTYIDEIRAELEGSFGRGTDRPGPAVLLYGGDFDPSGEDILRDTVERIRGDGLNGAGVFDQVVRVALTPEQVDEYDLPEMPGKETDSRAAGFEAKHGRLVQVELDALDPEDLRELYQAAIDEFWDESAFERALAQEEADREALDGGAA